VELWKKAILKKAEPEFRKLSNIGGPVLDIRGKLK